ncbi:FAD-dependent oxidoreductase [Streptomyces goshikiensis]|uniref:FAD-dependent oxidoreductase n=1 Tax=Streptomyces goshikiensis TaxID=1942 RepID=UPI0038223501
MAVDARADADLDVDVVVVGAGPVGLSGALLLARAGLGVVVLDRRPGPVTESRATDLHARTLEARTPSELVESLHPLGRRVDTVEMWSRVHEDAEGVTVRSGALEPLRARWVVAADGAASTLQALSGTPFRGRTYAGTWQLADLRVEAPSLDPALDPRPGRTGHRPARRPHHPGRAPAPRRVGRRPPAEAAGRGPADARVSGRPGPDPGPVRQRPAAFGRTSRTLLSDR